MSEISQKTESPSSTKFRTIVTEGARVKPILPLLSALLLAPLAALHAVDYPCVTAEPGQAHQVQEGLRLLRFAQRRPPRAHGRPHLLRATFPHRNLLVANICSSSWQLTNAACILRKSAKLNQGESS